MKIGKLVQECSEHLELKNYAKTTIMTYCSCVKLFLIHFSRKERPKDINEEEIRDYLLTLSSSPLVSQNIGALQIFYKHIIRQPRKLNNIERPRKSKKLPIPLDKSDVQRILNACTNLKHKSMLAVMYSAGLRISEVINLKIEHINSKRMVINIIQGKGKKDRQVPLDLSVLGLLRKYYMSYNPKEYLFNGQNSILYSASSIRKFLWKYCDLSGVKRIHPHILRHSYATSLIEDGKDISIVQRILGHNSIKSTQIYTHISTNLISNVSSPISTMNLN